MLDDDSFRRNLEAANNRRAERIARDLERAEKRLREQQQVPVRDHQAEGGDKKAVQITVQDVKVKEREENVVMLTATRTWVFRWRRLRSSLRVRVRPARRGHLGRALQEEVLGNAQETQETRGQ